MYLYILLLLSDGFKAINQSFDAAVIAGMGGNLIKTILEDSILKVKGKKLIIEANKDQSIVREYLMNHGFMIQDEFAINDNDKYYDIMVAIPGNITYTPNEIKFDPILLKKKP